jgi:archaemetzincin
MIPAVEMIMQILRWPKTLYLACFFTWAATVVPGQSVAGQDVDGSAGRPIPNHVQSLIPALEPLHQKLAPPRPGDWLDKHSEQGQSFGEYVRSNPITLTPPRTRLYVLPLGEFGEKQRRLVALSAEFLGIYFSCTVVTLEPLSLADCIPQQARRVHPKWGIHQIKSTFILDTLLPPRIPPDGVALICFTTSDLYPSEDWNFVFGQASLHNRVGVWSIFRNGDPDSEFELCLRRTLRIATHETGHMLSMPHCVAFQCNMCGSNSLNESDRLPLYLCPECVSKVVWATGCDPVARFMSLRDFCLQNSLLAEAEYYKKAIQRLQ